MLDDYDLEEPNEEDCCHNGCNPCVFDIYQTKLKTKSLKDVSVRTDLLSQTKFKPFSLIDAKDEGLNCKLFRFQPQGSSLEGKLPYRPGQHFVLRAPIAKNENQTVQREYSIIFDSEDCCFSVAIKLYRHGKMSRYVQGLKTGDTTVWRGPYGDFEYTPNSFRCILLLGMGTGVAPLYSVAKSIVEDDNDETTLTAFLSFRDVSSVILRQRLNALMSFWNFKCVYYFSNGSKGPLNILESGVDHRLGIDDVRNALSSKANETLVLICGSEEYCKLIKSYAVETQVPEKNIFTF